jgi:glycosyltransferase involved in cell wall biosynthesis
MIEISIIIPVRNQKDILSLALASLKQQIKRPRVFEIVVCDDGSADATGEMLKRLRYPIFFKYFVNEKPLGRAANRNLGAQKSSGRELIFFDGDMVPGANYVETILSSFEPNVVKVGEVKPPANEKIGSLARYLYSRGRHNLANKSQSLPGRLFTSNNFCISRELYEQSGGFDPKFKSWGGEDIDYGLRLVSMGAIIRNEPGAITYHHHKRTIDSLTRDFYGFGQSSFAYLIHKHPYFLEQLPARYLRLGMQTKDSSIFYRLLSIMAINGIMLRSIQTMVSHFGGINWPDSIFDYLLWGNLALGYKHRK